MKASNATQGRQTKHGQRKIKSFINPIESAHKNFRADDNFYRSILESLEDFAVFTTDVKGTISSWNRGAERLLGYKQAEIIGKKAAILFTPEDRKKNAPKLELKTAVEKRRALDERFHRRKDGSDFWGSGLVFPLEDNQGKLSGFTKIMRDLTESKQAEDRMFEIQKEADIERQRLHDLFMQAPAMIAILRGPKHIFELANPLYIKLAGGKRKLIGKPIREALPELKGQGFYKLLDNVYKTGEPFIGDELRANLDRNDTGQTEECYFNFVYQPSRSSSGAIDGILIHAVEVTGQVIARKKAEESQQRFEAAFDQAAVGMAQISLDGRWLEVNHKLCDMLGYSQTELFKKTFLSVTHTDDRESTKRVLNSLLNNKVGHESLQKRYITKSGKIIWVDVTVALVRDNKGRPKYFSKVIEDITKQKKAEEKLRENEERFTLAQQAANIGTFEWNIKTGNLVCTPELEKLYGLRLGGFGGKYKNWLKALHPDDRGRVELELQTAANGKRLDSEFRTVWPNGTVRWIAVRGRVFLDAQGKPERLLGINRNITKRKQAEESLKESEKQFRQLADSMPQIVWTASAKGIIGYYNRQWYKYTGLKTGSIDESWQEILHPDDLQRTLKVWHDSLKNSKPFQIELRFKDRHKAEDYRWFLARSVPVKDNTGKTIEWFGTCTDIDDVKRTTKRQKELEEITQRLTEQREQLIALNEAKEEFISLASHQLRTPATGVKQYVGMLLEGYAGTMTKQQRNMLQYAYESNERQLRIIDDLLRVAHVDAGKVTPSKSDCALVPLVQNVLQEQISKFRERHQKLVLNKPDEAITIEVDPQLIRMVLENLVDNASKYSPVGKTITIAIGQKAKAKKATVSIKDQGVGIDRNEYPKLFQKFSRLDNPLSQAVGGTGLGLYWVKKIVDLHGGDIKVTSAVDKGSTFTLELPLPV